MYSQLTIFLDTVLCTEKLCKELLTIAIYINSALWAKDRRLDTCIDYTFPKMIDYLFIFLCMDIQKLYEVLNEQN